ncbi:hypothetical protein Emag_007405 [Eimeria magna]
MDRTEPATTTAAAAAAVAAGGMELDRSDLGNNAFRLDILGLNQLQEAASSSRKQQEAAAAAAESSRSRSKHSQREGLKGQGLQHLHGAQ